MFEAFANPAATGPVSVLFHPSAVPVMDVFRSLGRLDDQYDLSVLDGPERTLMAYTRPDLAKAIISDALLLAFAITRQRGRSFHYRPLRSRHGTLDEYCLMVLIGASRVHDVELAGEAAAALGLGALNGMASLIGELARQIELGSLVFDAPSPAEFKAVLGNRNTCEFSPGEPVPRTDFQFRF